MKLWRGSGIRLLLLIAPPPPVMGAVPAGDRTRIVLSNDAYEGEALSGASKCWE